MSDHATWVTNELCQEDYDTLRAALLPKAGGKWFGMLSEGTYQLGGEKHPLLVLAGRVATNVSGAEADEIIQMVDGVVTQRKIVFAVIDEFGEIHTVVKDPNGFTYELEDEANLRL